MFSRRTLPVWIGILALSGMFLIGQESWPPCRDLDGDGYGDPASASCTNPESDCDDEDMDVNPGAEETCDNNIDDDCDGLVDANDSDCRGYGLLPDNGITSCYDDNQAIECPAQGEPFYGQDAQYVLYPMSFSDNEDGTVTDNVTGLMWQQEDDDVERIWVAARDYCQDLTLSGHADWRLPDEYQLQSIVDYGRHDPAIDPSYFPGTSGWYWSSRNDVSGPVAWRVSFNDGYILYDWMSTAHYVRCVRRESLDRSLMDNEDGTVTDNITGLMWQQQDDDIRRIWEVSLDYCENLVLADYTDWRLPNIKELFSITGSELYFPGTDLYFYWSSSTYLIYTNHAWVVDFKNASNIPASFYGKIYDLNVRCVRLRRSLGDWVTSQP